MPAPLFILSHFFLKHPRCMTGSRSGPTWHAFVMFIQSCLLLSAAVVERCENAWLTLPCFEYERNAELSCPLQTTEEFFTDCVTVDFDANQTTCNCTHLTVCYRAWLITISFGSCMSYGVLRFGCYLRSTPKIREYSCVFPFCQSFERFKRLIMGTERNGLWIL